MDRYEIAVIGGGAAGLTAALFAKMNTKGKVVILERGERVGKKIAATGNGRGNITNRALSIENYHGELPQFCEYALKGFDNNAAVAFFEELGMLTVSDQRGRVYPSGLQASSIVDLFRNRLKTLKTEEKTGFFVKKLEKRDIFYISSDTVTIAAKKVIAACGGMSGQGFGTDGNAYKLFEGLGHTVTPLSPSLVKLKTQKEQIKGLKGIKCDGILKFKEKSERGDILFTDNGISGDAVFALSGEILSSKERHISVEFLPGYTKDELENALKRKAGDTELSLDALFLGILPKMLGFCILKRCGLTDLSGLACKHTGSFLRLADTVKDFRLEVTGSGGFEASQVTKGGIRTSEADERTMMSRLTEGLYFAGEILDIDGDCGGYNLQWAWSSGRLAGISAGKAE